MSSDSHCWFCLAEDLRTMGCNSSKSAEADGGNRPESTSNAESKDAATNEAAKAETTKTTDDTAKAKDEKKDETANTKDETAKTKDEAEKKKDETEKKTSEPVMTTTTYV